MHRAKSLVILIAFGAACFCAGAYFAGRPAAAENLPTPRTVKPEVPLNRSLDANLWMQTSAEYRACCYQAYNLARRRLIEKLHDAPKSGWAKPPAVILDLDETVVDNSAYQTRIARNGLTFDEKTWDDFEENSWNEVRLVPGAKEFIDEAKRLGVAIVYISNRSEKKELKAGTLKTLEKLGLSVPVENTLFMEKISDKTARRAAVEAKYTVLLYIGDNLRDLFEGDFRSPIDNSRPGKGTDDPVKLREVITKRAHAVDRCQDLFGREWIILPNPTYGEWMKVLNLGAKDQAMLMGQPPTKSAE